jgi:hypothetical protein
MATSVAPLHLEIKCDRQQTSNLVRLRTATSGDDVEQQNVVVVATGSSRQIQTTSGLQQNP